MTVPDGQGMQRWWDRRATELASQESSENDGGQVTESNESDSAPTWRERIPEFITLAGAGLVVLLGAGVFAALWAYPKYDRTHTVPIECTVDSADGGTARSGGARGVSRTIVRINTEECGRLELSWKVNDSNVHRIVSQLEAGEKYVFQIGELSTRVMQLLLKTDTAPRVYSFEKAD
ncbi:hypothetical protein ACIPVK_09495 [Paeniglutamicibacter sp. MACA_103]|uniref:hypothetical protein n=1 Tax=Paeniglutamicibacter sp. MACA_103 TaxID=3377337 RepID=UPI003895AC6D